MPVPKRLGALLAAATLAATATITPTASAATGDDAAVVNAWYTDFLGRSAELDPSSQYWEDRLAVQTPSDVVWALTHTAEFNNLGVENLYRRMLNRFPDPGARYWSDGVNSGRFPLEWVRQNIAASPEYVNKPADAGVTLVQRWYDEVFGIDSDRQARPGEIAYWNGRIAAVGYLDAFRELYYAYELVTLRVAENYRNLLGRFPDGRELNYWRPKEVESDINVAVLIAATPEYRSLAS